MIPRNKPRHTLRRLSRNGWRVLPARTCQTVPLVDCLPHSTEHLSNGTCIPRVMNLGTGRLAFPRQRASGYVLLISNSFYRLCICTVALLYLVTCVLRSPGDPTARVIIRPALSQRPVAIACAARSSSIII